MSALYRWPRREDAGGRVDLLAAEVGRWVGFYEDQNTLTLTTALRALPLDMDDAIRLGAHRRTPPGLESV